MAIVIDALDLVRNKKRLPTEAFFVDTNIVLDYADPFGRSLDRNILGRRNADATEVVHWLKSGHCKALGTFSVALEYYKVVQVGFYQVFVDKGKPSAMPTPFNREHFKRLRDSDTTFIEQWSSQLKVFKKTFTKHFPLLDTNVSSADVLSTFDGIKVDLGDHFLSKSAAMTEDKMRCVYSNDADFYTFPDDIYLLTTNGKIIAQAATDLKLHKA